MVRLKINQIVLNQPRYYANGLLPQCVYKIRNNNMSNHQLMERKIILLEERVAKLESIIKGNKK